jgi:hypothetical protein
MPTTFASVIAAFGSGAKQKLSNSAVTGQPEDQLRTPFEALLADLALLGGVQGVSSVTSPRHVRLHGKGDKWRTCRLWEETARLLRQWLDERACGRSARPGVHVRDGTSVD